MKTFRVLCISRYEKNSRRLESAVAGGQYLISKVDDPDRALELLPHDDIAFVVYCDEFTPARRTAFFRKLHSTYATDGFHILIFSKLEETAVQCGLLYTSGVVDHLPLNASLGLISTRFEVYKRMYAKKRKIRELLENMMPPAVVDELERRGKFPPRRHGLVTVLFTDFVRFTEKTEEVQPVELVQLLDWYYRHFDQIITAHKLEKIKTIGDAYMCAGGVPRRNGFNPVGVTLAALAICEFMKNTARQNRFKGKPVWDLRIGLNSGHLVSGIVGKLKYVYDIWGETVNVASRMENNGAPGRINVSESTYEYIKDYFNCEYRGEIAAKYIGNVKMYFVNSLKPEYSVNGNGRTPTYELKQLAGIIHLDYEGAKQYMFTRLRNELPGYLEYHGLHHTVGVLEAVENLGKTEELTDEELVLVSTAAIYHDCGYLESYWSNEEIAVKTARKTLPRFGYSTAQIKTICAIIRSTKIRAVPKTKLEKIMNDADYDYLGRTDYTTVAAKLFSEWQHLGTTMPKKQWLQTQILFLQKHVYYTRAAKDLRESQKLKNIIVLQNKLRRAK